MPQNPVRTLALALAAGLLTLSCRTPEKKDQPIVHNLSIEGAEEVKSGELKKRILTTETSWLPFTDPQYFDPDIWQTDLRRIERYYRERGFYQARVVKSEVVPRDKNRVDLRVLVNEGRPTRVNSVSIEGLEDLPDDQRRRILGALPLHPGDVFLEDEWEGLKNKIATSLRELGYAEATVNGIGQVDLATQRADLKIAVQPGRRYRFGNIDIHQEEKPRVETWRIREQAQGALTTGDWYSQSAQKEAEARIAKLGVFGAVKVKPGPPDAATGTVPIEADVRESRFQTLRLGVGIGVDQTRNDARGIAEYTNRDFLGGLRKLTLRANAGWAWIPNVYTSAELGGRNGPVAKLAAELEQPRVFFHDLKAETRLELERGIEPAYSFIGGRYRLGLIWQPSPWLSIFPSYNFELYRLQAGVASPIGRAPQLLFGCPETCALSYLEERVEWDRRDDRQEPRRGYYLAIALQEGGGPLGGSFKYLRIEPEGRYYYSFLAGDRLTLAARLKLGSLLPASGNPLDSPIVARFFLGGASGMRGFGTRRLSPMQVVAVSNTGPGATQGLVVPIGGNGLLDSSFEARYRLTGPLVVAAFVDTGFVTSESLNFKDPGSLGRNMLFAFGAGIRYLTPIGPVRLDLAYRPDIGPPLQVYPSTGTALTYQRSTGCFGIGGFAANAGAPEGPCTVEISIGEAF